MSVPPPLAFLLHTDLFGRILSVLAADPSQAARLSPGSFLAELVADRSSGPLLDFLLTLRRLGATVSAQLELAPGPSGGEAAAPKLYLGGVQCDEGAWIWGACSAEEALAQGRALASTPEAPGPPPPFGAALRLFGSAPAAGPEVEALRRDLAAAQAEVDRLREELARVRGRAS